MPVPAPELRLEQECPSVASRFFSDRVRVPQHKALLEAVHRCVPENAVVHIRRVPAHRECVLRSVADRGLRLLRRLQVSVLRDDLRGQVSVMSLHAG